MQLPGFKNAEGAAGNSALCGPGAARGVSQKAVTWAKPQAASNKRKKYLTEGPVVV